MPFLGVTDAITLHLLETFGPMNHKEMGRRYPDINHMTFRNATRRLEKRGYVSSSWADSPSGERGGARRVYTIGPKGQVEIQKWRHAIRKTFNWKLP